MGNFISSSGIYSRTMVVLYKRETVKQEPKTQDVFAGYSGLYQPIPFMGLPECAQNGEF